MHVVLGQALWVGFGHIETDGIGDNSYLQKPHVSGWECGATTETSSVQKRRGVSTVTHGAGRGVTVRALGQQLF